jgi:hypothetical protein
MNRVMYKAQKGARPKLALLLSLWRIALGYQTSVIRLRECHSEHREESKLRRTDPDTRFFSALRMKNFSTAMHLLKKSIVTDISRVLVQAFAGEARAHPFAKEFSGCRLRLHR